MNKFITKQGSRIAAFAVGLVLFSTVANAQDLEVGANACVTNKATGKIVFKNNTGRFKNSQPLIATKIINDGVIEFLGTDNTFTGGATQLGLNGTTNRVPGKVSYASAVATQNIFPGYYTDLDMAAAGVKDFGTTTVYIGQNYTTAGGTRDYGTSTINYDGGTATMGSPLTQIVAAENGANSYNNVVFTEDGLKTLSGFANVDGTTNIEASTNSGGVRVAGGGILTANGNLTQATGAGDLSIVGTSAVNVYGPVNGLGAVVSVTDGTLTLGDDTNPSVTTVTGSLDLAGTTGILAAKDNSTLNVDGGFTNTLAARTNMTFDPTSLVDYLDNATTVMTTANSNPYGKFEISKTTGAIAPDATGTSNIEIATSFAMNGGGGNNLDMLNNGGGYVNMLSGAANNVTYVANEEVVGEFRRTHAFTPGQDNVFNNAATVANFASSTGNYFSFIVDPNGQTDSYVAATDVERDINIEYDLTAWVADITAGYQAADVTTLVSNGNTEAQIRFREGTSAPLDEKVSTGNAYVRSASGPGSLGSVKLPAMEYTNVNVDGSPDAGFFAGNDLILRAGPAIWYSVNAGRWSNPATWDEGTEPPTDAEVVIRNNVHAGFIRATDNHPDLEAFPGAMATKITIQNPATDPLYPNPTLIIGKNTSDGTYPGDFATSTAAVTGITNPGRIIVEQIAPTIEVAPATLTEATIDVSAKDDYVAGLVVYENSQITASESLINDGCLNIGGTLAIGQ